MSKIKFNLVCVVVIPVHSDSPSNLELISFKQCFDILKKQNPDASEYDLMKQAEQRYWAGAAAGLATNAILTGTSLNGVPSQLTNNIPINNIVNNHIYNVTHTNYEFYYHD